MQNEGGTEPVEAYTKRIGRWATSGAGVWLVFLIPTATDIVERGGWHAVVGMVLLVAFGAAYVVTFYRFRARRPDGGRWEGVRRGAVLALAGLHVLAALTTVVAGSSGLSCYVYVAVAGTILLPTRWAWPQAVVIAGATEGLARVVPGWERADTIGVSVLLATFAVWGIMQAIGRSVQLAESREENARLLVGQERARMARDLHDILGHSLTVVTVKAELTGRLLEAATPEALDRARTEVADLERLSRDALADVRRTVEGFRDLSLPVEVTRARSALEAAEIEADLPRTTEDVPSEWRELFAWTVREGVTNVVRHSGARRCTVTLAPDRVRVVDDGGGCPRSDGPASGHGLVGLRERAGLAGATVLVESPPGGGFALTVLVPSAAADPAPAASPRTGGVRGRVPGVAAGPGAAEVAG